MSTLLWRTETRGAGPQQGADTRRGSVGKDTHASHDYADAATALAVPAAATKRAPSPASSSLRKARSAFDLSPRLGTTDDGFFSWKRWYAAPAPPPPQVAVPALPAPDDVSRLVRDALRRRREADDDASLASSAASSNTSGASTDSPASSSGTWDTSASESSKAAPTAGPLRSSGYDQEDLDGLPTLAYGTSSSPRLRAAQSVATLKAPRMIRRVSSSASISPVPVELPPRSPHAAVTSPTFSPLFDDDPFAALAEAPAFPLPPSPSLEPAQTSLRSRLASSLRRSASAITLRNPLRSSASPSSPIPPVPTLPPASSGGPSAAAILRDLLLKHDSVVDPSTEPLSSLFDPTLATLAGDDCAFADADEDEDESEARRYYSSSSDDERDGVSTTSSDESASTSSQHTDGDDDPFRATAPAHLAWMAPAAAARGGRSVHDDDSASLDSPSSAFPPFDPFALADLGPAPPLPLPFAFASAHAAAATAQRARPPRSRPAPPPPRIITKQRSFVDPRTRQLRTAPSVCVTPSTPEKKTAFASARGEGER
ncbi:hypothetical protein JCM9279_007631 [Rhodotorula babjevae]